MKTLVKVFLLFVFAVPVAAFVGTAFISILFELVGLAVEPRDIWSRNFGYFAGMLAGWWIWGASA